MREPSNDKLAEIQTRQQNKHYDVKNKFAYRDSFIIKQEKLFFFLFEIDWALQKKNQFQENPVVDQFRSPWIMTETLSIRREIKGKQRESIIDHLCDQRQETFAMLFIWRWQNILLRTTITHEDEAVLLVRLPHFSGVESVWWCAPFYMSPPPPNWTVPFYLCQLYLCGFLSIEGQY